MTCSINLFYKNVALPTVLVYAMDNAVHLAAARDINQAMTDGALQPAIVARYPLTAPAAAHDAVDRENLIGKVVIEVVA